MKIPHYKSFRDVVLPRMSAPALGLDFVSSYTRHLQEMQELDFYEFQKLPLWGECTRFIDMMVARGTPQAEAMSFVRLIAEEAYAVSAFEHAGRRILKPTAQLSRELLNTDATVPINEILPPFPSCYIELPHDSGFSIGDEDEKPRRVLGIYVTWSETSKETAKNQAEYETKGIWRDSQGMLRVCNDDAERKIGKLQDLPPANALFGDYFARFNIISEGPADQPQDMHNFTATFFNMHWTKDSTIDAEDLFEQSLPNWKLTTRKKIDYDRLVEAFHLAVNLFVYMSSPQYSEDVQHKPNPLIKSFASEMKKPKNRRNQKLVDKLFKMMLAETYEIGQNVEVVVNGIDPAGIPRENSGGEHASPKTHWRRAHWRRVWCKRAGEDVQDWRRIQRVLVQGRGPVPTITTYEVRHAKPSAPVQHGTAVQSGNDDQRDPAGK
jgi:hypothetical protein